MENLKENHQQKADIIAKHLNNMVDELLATEETYAGLCHSLLRTKLPEVPQAKEFIHSLVATVKKRALNQKTPSSGN